MARETMTPHFSCQPPLTSAVKMGESPGHPELLLCKRQGSWLAGGHGGHPGQQCPHSALNNAASEPKARLHLMLHDLLYGSHCRTISCVQNMLRAVNNNNKETLSHFWLKTLIKSLFIDLGSTCGPQELLVSPKIMKPD